MTPGALSAPLRETLAVFDDAPRCTPLTTREVADAVDLTRRSTYERLDRLVERGEIETKKVGARGRVWWRPGAATAGTTDAGAPFAGELDEVVERIGDAFYALDEEWRFTYVNEQAGEIVDRRPSELLGAVIWEEMPWLSGTLAEEKFSEAMATGRQIGYEEHFDPTDQWFDVRVYPSESGISVYFRDVSERKEREQRLERYQTVIETVEDGVYVLDESSRFTLFNEALLELTGYERADLLGEHTSFVTPEEYVVEYEAEAAALASGHGSVATIESEVETAAGERVPVETRISLFPFGDGEYGRVGVVRDVTERKQRERRLEESEHRYRTLAEHIPNGIVALFDEDLQYTLAEGQSSDALDVESYDLVGHAAGDNLEEEASREQLRENCRAALRGEVNEFEFRYRGHVIRAWTLPVSDEEGDVFAGMVMTQDVTEHIERERELEGQRHRLAALNDLNRVVRGITEAIVEKSSREEIEAAVCEGLAASDSYAFAWIGEVVQGDDVVRIRTEAGVEGYLDDLTISVDPDDAENDGPSRRAVLTREVKVVNDVLEDPAFEGWHDHAREHGYRSLAVVPLAHEGTLYGLLSIYAPRPDAFGGEERDVVGQLGEVVTQAITAVERKQALVSDEVVELTFYNRGFVESLGIDWNGGRISLDRTVPAGDGDYLVYGHATRSAVGALDGLVEHVRYWRSATTIEEADGQVRFELRLEEPPVLSIVTAHGGYVDRMVVEDGNYRFVAHLPQGAEVRQIIDAIGEVYPATRLVTRRQVTRETGIESRVDTALHERLTERQRSALEAAYYAGYFSTPRKSSGGDLASSMGVSPPTFHQHLRRGQEKLLEATFEEGPAD